MNEEKMDDYFSSCIGKDFHDLWMWNTGGADN